MCKPFKSLILMLLLGSVLTTTAIAADPSLVLYYMFDEGSGTMASDSSGNGNDGTVNGNALWVAGYKGGALEFDGVAAYVEVARPIQDDFTMMAWIKTGTAGAAGTQAYQGTGLLWSDVGGAANDFVVAVLGTKLSFFCGNPDLSVNSNGDIVTSEWVHIAVVRDTGSQTISVFIDGLLDNSISHSNTNPLNAQPVLAIGANTLDNRYYTGLIDEVQIYNRALTDKEIQTAMRGAVGLALDPSPEHEVSDVPRDNLVLSWAAGEFAHTHNVYFGTSFDDVNDAGTESPLLLSQSQEASQHALSRLAFSQTYYWRIDEVNAAPDLTVYKGDVWRFTVEPYSIMVPVDIEKATASSFANVSTAAMTVNGSGLVNGAHSTSQDDMWLSAPMDMSPWLMVEFDSPQKLDRLLIWNSNSVSEGFIGWGIKDVQIEYSVDGVDWTGLAESNQISRAPGLTTYDQPQAIDLGLALAKYVRINILNNWGGILKQYGVSEIQFYGLPVYARTPSPADQAVDVVPDGLATWRAGREADAHQVLLSQDPNAVSEGVSVTSTTHSVDMSSLNLLLGETYYWQVVEVNENMDPSQWVGDVWNLTTANRITVDDFEGYTNFSPNRPFQTWLDGIGYSADEFFAVGFDGNGSGAAVGHDIWSGSSAYFEGDIMEQVLTAEASGQSMPIYYSGNSKADRTFAPAQDWSVAGIKTLVLYFNGDRANAPATLYVTLNNTRVDYPNGAALSTGLWTQWNIDLASLGIALNSITKMSIGIDSGGSGVVLVDQISLYRNAPEAPVSSDPGTANLVAQYSFENDYTDSSGHGLTGTPIGAPMFESGLPGNGSAVTLNGNDDYVELPMGSLMSTLTDCTFSIWANFSGQGGNWQRLIDFGSGTTQYFLITPSSGGGVLLMEMNGPDAGTSQLAAPMRLPTGWHHVAGVIDSTTMEMTLYLDGSVVAQGPTASLPADAGVTTQNWLGRSQYPDPYYDGSLDEFRIYNRVLSEGEIRYLAGDK
ncbi:MAG: discoidin domain-containing protein [Phycisphaerae bacterium]|nr:discoidin domain-containing protein [Phycisphaerae bacterium]